MGMFDNITATNVVHESFAPRHNQKVFQTKTFDNKLSDFVVTDGFLYQVSADFDVFDEPVLIDYTGKVDLFTIEHMNGIECAIGYDFTFENGALTHVDKDQPRAIGMRGKVYAPPAECNSLADSDLQKSGDAIDAQMRALGADKVNEIKEVLGLSNNNDQDLDGLFTGRLILDEFSSLFCKP